MRTDLWPYNGQKLDNIHQASGPVLFSTSKNKQSIVIGDKTTGSFYLIFVLFLAEILLYCTHPNAVFNFYSCPTTFPTSVNVRF